MAGKNIESIFNYCDRWCERCSFTSRCAVFQEEAASGDENLDMKNKLFWERLSQNFAKARTLLEEMAQRSGIDMEALKAEVERSEDTFDQARQKSQEHALNQDAMSYMMTTAQWLKTQPGMLEKLEVMKSDLSLGIESQAQARANMETIKESLSVIEWYHHFIPPKINRAVRGRITAEEWKEGIDDPQHDFNGSAKIALIAIERSMAAWANLFDLLPEQEDHFLSILGMLDKMKRELMEEFPLCMGFVRPGFDEISESPQ